ncbi:MAG: hypothetical protein EOO24_10615 [Comamonadaceae bacterium]|nr:MAG: hypothetical protein EOO24_10615 [Comamonadaceae bacterium]
MSDPGSSFSFGNFVPGFDFLKNLASGAASGAGAGAGASPLPGLTGLTGLSSWVAPTLSVEEVDKRIQELKAVQFWLDQNVHALRATIQALEVQKMTLSTLQGMNLRMEDLAKSFTGAGAAPPAPPEPAAARAPAPAPAAAAPVPPAGEPAGASGADEAGPAADRAATPGVIDPLQWWGALTQQFEQIAGTAMREAASFEMPAGSRQDKARGGGTSRSKATGDSAAAAGSGATRKPASATRSTRAAAKSAGATAPRGAAARTTSKKR